MSNVEIIKSAAAARKSSASAPKAKSNSAEFDKAQAAIKGAMEGVMDDAKRQSTLTIYMYHDAEGFGGAWMLDTLKSKEKRERLHTRLAAFSEAYVEVCNELDNAKVDAKKKGLSIHDKARIDVTLEDAGKKKNAALVLFERAMLATLYMRQKNPEKVQVNTKTGRVELLGHKYDVKTKKNAVDKNGKPVLEWHSFSGNKLVEGGKEIVTKGQPKNDKKKPATAGAATVTNAPNVINGAASLIEVIETDKKVVPDDATTDAMDKLLMKMLRHYFYNPTKKGVDTKAIEKWIADHDKPVKPVATKPEEKKTA